MMYPSKLELTVGLEQALRERFPSFCSVPKYCSFISKTLSFGNCFFLICHFRRSLVACWLFFFFLYQRTAVLCIHLSLELETKALFQFINRENLDIPLSDRQKKQNLNLDGVCSEILNSSSRGYCRAPNPASASASDPKWAEANSDLNVACQASMALNLSLWNSSEVVSKVIILWIFGYSPPAYNMFFSGLSGPTPPSTACNEEGSDAAVPRTWKLVYPQSLAQPYHLQRLLVDLLADDVNFAHPCIKSSKRFLSLSWKKVLNLIAFLWTLG